MIDTGFRGQTAVVTGGTRGIGLAIARELSKQGVKVIVTGTSPSAPKGLTTSVKAPQRKAINYLQANFSTEGGILEFIGKLKRLSRIDILVNNAGINRINPIDKILAEDWQAVECVNLRAPLLITRAVSAIMRRTRYGRIVNIGSIFGSISKSKRALYSMSKFGLHGLTVSSALDLAPHHILVNSLSPGFVMTDLTRKILTKPEIGKLEKQVPLGRFANPQEIAKSVLFLASPTNTYITGQNLIVDGGFVGG